MRLLRIGIALFFSLSAFAASAALLDATFTPLPSGSNVNLTAIGRLDWVHWGFQSDSSINRKAFVTPRISDFTVTYDTNFSYAAAYQLTDNANGYSWFDGAPTASVSNSTTGVYVVGPFNITETNGFEFSIAADTNVQTCKIFVGTFAARGRLQASLSDNSATPYSNNLLVNSGSGPGAVYTVNFAAASSNQTLNIRWTVAQKFRVDGNVTLQAATLDAANANNPPYVSITTPTNFTQVTVLMLP